LYITFTTVNRPSIISLAIAVLSLYITVHRLHHLHPVTCTSPKFRISHVSLYNHQIVTSLRAITSYITAHHCTSPCLSIGHQPCGHHQYITVRLVHQLYITVHHCTSLVHCTSLYIIVRQCGHHCTSLYITVHHCNITLPLWRSLYITVHHCTSLRPSSGYHCTPLYITVHHCGHHYISTSSGYHLCCHHCITVHHFIITVHRIPVAKITVRTSLYVHHCASLLAVWQGSTLCHQSPHSNCSRSVG
jgi:hypothetical protein